MNSCAVTIGFSAHHLEALPLLRASVQKHEAVVLEEPPSPNFRQMLDQSLSIEDYLMEVDPQFPKFDHAMCAMVRELCREGKSIYQVEPYLEMLLEIHELLAAGKTATDVLHIDGLKQVYLAERNATGALIGYYASIAKDPFEGVVERVKTFARADAMRLNLRAQLRAQAVFELTAKHDSLFVEAGYIHFTLFRHLRRRMSGRQNLSVEHLMRNRINSLGGKRLNLGPGDLLTLRFIFHRQPSEALNNLQAARSLIYIKLIATEELVPDACAAPHAEDEVKVNRLVDRLSFDDCAQIFDQVRLANRERALAVVEEFLQKRR